MHLSDDVSTVCNQYPPQLEEPGDIVENTTHATAISYLSPLPGIESVLPRPVIITIGRDHRRRGMPEFRHELPEPIREYHEHLYTVDGVVIYK